VPLVFTDSQLERLSSYLNTEERARAARYLVSQPRHQFVGCRVALKILLANELCIAPSDVRLALQRWGKPVLHPGMMKALPGHFLDFDVPMQFSVSHSADCGLIGLSRSPIGVDLEYCKPRLSVASLANMVLSPREQATWKSMPAREHEQQMLRLWVCKEALLKALGLGIAECLQQISFPLPVPTVGTFAPSWMDPAIQIHLEEGPNCGYNSWTLSGSWTIHPIESSDHHVAAVATLGRQSKIEVRDFVWDAIC